MEDIFGATFAALAGVVVCAAGCVALRPTWTRVRRSRSWARTSAHVTRAWKLDGTPSQPGGTMYHVNYTFTAPETGGSYYGHSENGPAGVEKGDDIEVMYDPKGPFDNDIPLGRFEAWFGPIAYGLLAVFGAGLAVGCLIVAALMIADQIRSGV